MLFNSLEFILFFSLFFALYWFVFSRSTKWRNVFILICSCVFYGWWDYRFLGLLFLSTIIDFFAGIQVSPDNSKLRRRIWITISLCANLGLLGFFKYFNFFIDSFADLLQSFGFQAHLTTLNIILPVGISFYTFQTLSYTIDVYRGQMQPTRDPVAFGAFVSFFPQLVAGPIERASHLLPQILNKTHFNFNTAIEGARLVSWGFFKKVILADSLAPSVNAIFGNYESYDGSVLALGAIYFAFQIYGDFSGYSDIARGISKWLGFDLMVNFNFPYFSTSISEFWRRWHISLSTWFRDYLYIPLGGSKVSGKVTIRNVFIIFLVSGFWHGANWTFVIWGLIHALLFLPSFLSRKKQGENGLRQGTWFKKAGQMLLTFTMVTFAWIFFRANDLDHASNFIARLFSEPWFTTPFLNPYNQSSVLYLNLFIIGFLLTEYFYYQKLGFGNLGRLHFILESAFFLAIILLFSPISENVAFIYFQF